MTIIIALKDKKHNRIILGSDKQVTKGELTFKITSKIVSLPMKIVDGYSKVKKHNKIHILFCGHAFFNTFLEYGFEVPNMENNQNFIEYLYKKFLPELCEKLKKNNMVGIDNNKLYTGSGFIVVYNNEIYLIDSHFGVHWFNDDYYVDGSGCAVAKGSLYTNLNFHSDMDYVEMVKQAIITAGDNTIYCDNDVEIKEIQY